MADSSTPLQKRTVDAFASYDSSSVNRLTRMITRGTESTKASLIADVNSCVVAVDTTSSTRVTVSAGAVYKDDVRIDTTGLHYVDFYNENHYVSFNLSYFVEGYYYVVLQYEYLKQRPAAEAKIKILMPAQRALYTTTSPYLFLGAVYLYATGGTPALIVSTVDTYDPENSSNKRHYVPSYIGSEVTLPTFDENKDKSRVIYVEDENAYYFGYASKWQSGLGGGGSSYETTVLPTFSIGDLVYTDVTGNLTKALMTSKTSTADGVITRLGSVTDPTGTVQVSGRVENIQFEPGVTISVGDYLYLSQSDAGHVTNIRTSTVGYQFVGRCIEVTDSTSGVILFVRGPHQEVSTGTTVRYAISEEFDLPSGSWVAGTIPSGGSGYYQEVDISDFNGYATVFEIYDSISKLLIQPAEVELYNTAVIRVWMPINTESLKMIIAGPSLATLSSSHVAKVSSTLSAASWVASGSYYYQTIPLPGIISNAAILSLRDTATNEEIVPLNITFDSTGIVTVWMNNNTLTLDLVAIGESNLTTDVIGSFTTLGSGGAWTSSSGLYYQDISLDGFSDYNVAISTVDSSTGLFIMPNKIQYLSSIVRIWMSTNTVSIDVTTIG